MQASHGDDGNQRVFQRVAEMDGAGGEAAGAGEPDVVGAQHLEHLGAHQPHDQRHLEQAERDRGHDQRLQPGDGKEPRAPPADLHDFAAAERGQPAQRHREQVDQQNADQEGRKRYADQRHRLEGLGEQGIAPERGVDAHQDAEHHGEDGGDRRKLQRRRHPLHQEVRDRLAELIGDAELELHGVGEVTHELHRNGIVEAERLAHRFAFGGGRIDADDLVDRIAREAEHRKRDDPDRAHDADGLKGAAKSESKHLILSLLFLGRRRHCQPEKERSRKPDAPGPLLKPF